MINISRKIDELGRIVIPIEVRKELGIKDGESLDITIIKNKIVLEKKSA